MNRHPTMRPLVHALAAATMAASLAGCVTQIQRPTTPSATRSAASSTTLPATPDALTDTNEVHRLVRNVMDLTDQQRFTEARRLLAGLRAAQPPRGVSWRAGLCAEMTLALREGDMSAFLALGEMLEPAWADPHRVDERCVAVVGLHRALTGRPLPLDLPPALGRIVQRVALP